MSPVTVVLRNLILGFIIHPGLFNVLICPTRITYEVLKMQPYLELSELVPGDGKLQSRSYSQSHSHFAGAYISLGAMAGSLVLNKRFEETVRNVVGDEQFADLKKGVGWAKALNEFDKVIKTAFTGDINEVHYVTFPKADLDDDPAEHLITNCWEMTGAILEDIFAPIIREVMRLVDVQILGAQAKRPSQQVKGIFLVGGFGSSRYLKRCLDDNYEAQGIQVIQPHDAWAAIVK